MVSATFSTALAAAAAAAGGQHYAQGALYVLATPIGNLADISLRALHVLGLADTVACEDTRHSQQMLRQYGISKNPGQWLALHQHNEAQAAQTVCERLQRGERVAYISDAGTPGISDPGARLCAAVRAQGLRCIPIPGASSVTALLSVAGMAQPDDAASAFYFHGFLSGKNAERARTLQQLALAAHAVVLLEAPHRIAALAGELASLGTRRVTVGRELSKQFEEIVTLEANQLSDWLASDANRLRGEFALVLHPQSATETAPDEDLRVLALLLPEVPLKTAVRLAAAITRSGRNTLYQQALELRAAAGDAQDAPQ